MPIDNSTDELAQAAIRARPDAYVHITSTDFAPIEEVGPHMLGALLRIEAEVGRMTTALERCAASLDSIDANTERRSPGRPRKS